VSYVCVSHAASINAGFCVIPRERPERVFRSWVYQGRNNSPTESRTKQFTLARIAVSSAEARFSGVFAVIEGKMIARRGYSSDASARCPAPAARQNSRFCERGLTKEFTLGDCARSRGIEAAGRANPCPAG
jgi:hypothetical protein